ncbi:MAG: hypothetical protein SOV56_01540 [Phascolarctobacterium sp.]|nr:hypothetical protein [Phascolarctobacterium sp.]
MIKFLAYLKKMNKLGVAMTEYAVLLAFVAAVGASFTSDSGLGSSISSAVSKAVAAIGLVSGEVSSTNKSYKIPGFTNEDDAAKYGATVDKICELVFNAYPDKQIAGFKYLKNGNLDFLWAYEKDKDGNDKIKRYDPKSALNTNIQEMLKNSTFKGANLGTNEPLTMCFDKNGNLTQQMQQGLTGSTNINTHIRFEEGNKLVEINSDGQLYRK